MTHDAMIFCATAHGRQVDKAGLPYVQHCMRVANNFTEPLMVTVGLLHDTVEDTKVTFEEVEDVFGKEVSDLVEVLTRRDGEKYFEYIKRVKACPRAVQIKLADLRDNMDVTRLKFVTSEDVKRQDKYLKAKLILETNK